LVSYLLRDFEPTLEIRLECLHFVWTPQPCKSKTVVKGILERDVVSGSGVSEWKMVRSSSHHRGPQLSFLYDVNREIIACELAIGMDNTVTSGILY
jgi:hypothetical protein